MAGCGPQFLAARWPDEIALYQAIAQKAAELRIEEDKALAVRIRNEIADMLKK